MATRVESIPENVNPKRKIIGPSLTVAQWNAVVDVLTAKEPSSSDAMNLDALDARDAIREYLRQSGHRNPHVA